MLITGGDHISLDSVHGTALKITEGTEFKKRRLLQPSEPSTLELITCFVRVEFMLTKFMG